MTVIHPSKTKRYRAERPRPKPWPSDLTWRYLTEQENARVRAKRLQLNLFDPNWRPPQEHGA